MKVYVDNIKWETDGEEVSGLPTQVVVDAECEEGVLNYLSDNFGWLVDSFKYTKITESILSNLTDDAYSSGFFGEKSSAYMVWSEENSAGTNNEEERLFKYAEEKDVDVASIALFEDCISFKDTFGNELIIKNDSPEILKGMFNSEDWLFLIVDAINQAKDTYPLVYIDC